MRLVYRAFVSVLGAGAIAFAPMGPLRAAQVNQAPPLASISEVLKGESVENPNTAQYVAMRCAALLYVFVQAIPETDVQRSGQRESLSRRAMSFMLRAQGIQEKVAPKNADFKDGFVMGSVKRMEDLYIDQAVDARARTGHFSSDPIIAADAEICGSINPS